MDLQYEHLLGRAYEPDRMTCYTLVRDFFLDNFGIALPQFSIPADWNADTLNLIEMIYEGTGFEKVEDWSIRTLRPADVLCVAVRSGNPNHFVINVGGNRLIHHPFNQMSCSEPMRDFWRMSTCFVLRHPAVPDLTPALPTVNIMDLARARYDLQPEA